MASSCVLIADWHFASNGLGDRSSLRLHIPGLPVIGVVGDFQPDQVRIIRRDRLRLGNAQPGERRIDVVSALVELETFFFCELYGLKTLKFHDTSPASPGGLHLTLSAWQTEFRVQASSMQGGCQW